MDILNIPNPLTCLHLAKISLQYCRLHYFPLQLLELIGLEELNVGQNKISEIPKEIEQLINLKTLDVDSNRIQTIPMEISRLKNLQQLDVSFNPITSVPIEMSEMKSLQKWFMQDIGISRSQLPREFNQMIEQGIIKITNLWVLLK